MGVYDHHPSLFVQCVLRKDATTSAGKRLKDRSGPVAFPHTRAVKKGPPLPRGNAGRGQWKISE